MVSNDIHCHKCGSRNLKVNVTVEFCTSIKNFHRLSKTAIYKSDTQILNTRWPEADIICMDCGYSTLNEKTDRLPAVDANVRVGDEKISDMEPEKVSKLKWQYHGKPV